VIKLTSNTRVFERMPGDMDLSAGGVLDGTESIESVGMRVFSHLRLVASGDVLAKAEQVKHREFQVWSERAVSL
jgi:altronate dehydratase